MKKHGYHPFHLVDKSPWPYTMSAALFMSICGMVRWMHQFHADLLSCGLLTTLIIAILWWRDVVRESTYQGQHTSKVIKGLRLAMILFITSEVLFFFSFFWAFFHSSLAPSPELGQCWPPVGITTFNPLSIPLLNTTILLASGLTVTWSHHAILASDLSQAKKSLSLTIMLGMYFIALQLFEYKEAPFTMADSVYGSTFFVATGFHGLHVIIGTLFLAVARFRMHKHHFSAHSHFGFEAAAWYWHFVDVVWLFLYISIYWWGG